LAYIRSREEYFVEKRKLPFSAASVSSEVKGVAVAVLRVPSWPFVEKRKLPFSAALRVLRG